jgi:hypothetical protein
MKKYIICLLVAISFSSCFDREERETYQLMEALFERELGMGDTIYLVEDAETDWIDKAGNETCDWEWLVDLFDDWGGRRPVDLSEVFTKEDVNYICSNSILEFRFQQNKLPDKFKLIPTVLIDEMVKEFNDMVISDGQINLTEQMEKLQIYFQISKPVFTQNYQYAFVYKATNCFPLACEGPAIFICKKENGRWKILYGANFYLI